MLTNTHLKKKNPAWSFNFAFNSWTETFLSAGATKDEFTPVQADKLEVTPTALTPELDVGGDHSRNI